MIETAWDEYRGWAARAKELQANSKRWNKAALICASAAAISGAAATQSAGTLIGQGFSLLAAVAAALSPVLGREILALGQEAKWISSRAAAEAIKSECFRFAAHSGISSAPDSDDQFEARRAKLTEDVVKSGLTAKKDSAGEAGDKRRPPREMDRAWYVAQRMDDQTKYYSDKQAEHEAAVRRLRLLAFAASAIAAVCGIAGFVNQQIFAPWIGALTTVATAFTAYGLLDRQEYLAASYAAMATALTRIKDRAATLPLAELVARAEDIMGSEHAAWTARMTRTIPVPKVEEKKL
jgi:SMODS and SLOG-associating 2TM effector domain 1/Protein of unknown function (DUF4231)